VQLQGRLGVRRCAFPPYGLKLSKHPDKTAMGRVERGFDFLGYHFTPQGISLAAQTLANGASKSSPVL
jgi:RNA-directed DNA polymerase